jgi:hypothetical protein
MSIPKGFRPIPGFEHSYAVNRAGDVLSCHRVVLTRSGRRYTVRARLLSAMTQRKSGYRIVVLSRQGEQTRFYVHRLVRDAWGV